MSVERPQHKTQRQEAPAQAPDYAERTEDFSEKTMSNRRKKFLIYGGTVAAGAALAAGILVGAKAFGGGHEAPAKGGDRPVATAPATPGETASTAPSHEATPSSPSEAETKAWTDETRPYVIDTNGDGKAETYVGEAEALKAVELSVADYPTAEDASKAIVARLEGWINFGTNPQAEAEYKNYHSETLPESSGVVGTSAMGTDHIDDLYRQALMSDEVQGAMVNGDNASVNDAWVQTIGEFRSDAGEYNYDASQYGNGTPYKMTLKFESVDCKDQLDATTAKGCTLRLTYSDNFSQTGIADAEQKAGMAGQHEAKSGTMEINYDLQQQDGVWKMIGANNTPEN